MAEEIKITCVREHAQHILHVWNGHCKRPAHYCDPKKCYFYKACDYGSAGIVKAATEYLSGKNDGNGICESIW